jgi:hypothetical protein
VQKVFQTVSKIHSQVRITETQAGCLIWFPSQRNSKPNHTKSSVPRWPGCSMNSRIQDSFKNLRHKGTHIFWPVMFSNCSNELAAHVHELEFLSVKRFSCVKSGGAGGRSSLTHWAIAARPHSSHTKIKLL